MPDTNQYFKSKEFLEILHKYEAARNSGSSIFMDADELTDIAEYYHSRNDIAQAEKVIDYAIKLFPGSTAPLVFKARKTLLIDFDPDHANEIAEEIEEKTDLDYFYIKAEIMIVDGQEDKANEYLKSHLADVDGDDLEDFYFDVANIFIDYQQDEKCKEWLELSKKKDSDDYKELEGRLALYAGDFKQSEKIFNDLLDKNPFSYNIWNQLASSQFNNDNIQDALQSSEYAIAINPEDGDAIITKASCLYALGNYKKSLGYYQRYSKLCPNDEYGELLYGINLFNLNRPQEALIHMKRAEEIAPQDSLYLHEIYQQIAFTESHLRHPVQAISYIQKAMRLQGEDQNELLVMKGHIQLENGQVEASEASYKKAIAESNLSPKILLHVAISLYDNEQPKLAYDILQVLISQVDPESTDGYSYLAMCCYELKKEEEFLQALTKACKVNPSEAKMVMGHLFPEELEPKDYYNYFINK